MNILLTAVNSKYIHSNLAVYSLKAYHDENTASLDTMCNVDIAEYTINQYPQDIVRDIYIRKPDVVAFSCYIWNVNYIKIIALELNKLLPDTAIWVGGPEVTYDATAFLGENISFTGVMIGEGEETFKEISLFYSDRICDLADIKGIAYRDAEGIHITGNRELLDMDMLPFVYRDMTHFENKIIYYESSRGCPYGCSYCLSSVEKSVRFRSLEIVFKELKYFLDIKVAQVKFVDRTFNCNHERTVKLLEFIRDNDNGVTNFHFEIAADLLKDDEIEIMESMRPGLIQLEIGVQSSNTTTINEIDRVMNLDTLSDVVGRINENHNVHQHLDLIAGLPYENIDSFKESFNYVYSLKPEQLQLGFLKVLKGSKMYRKAKEYGIVYTDLPPYEVLYTKWLSFDDVIELKKIEEMTEVYYNSRMYVNTLNAMMEFFDTPYEMYKYMADYYDSNKLFDVKHSRITRYEILKSIIDCVIENYAQDKEKESSRMTQILIFDLYLKENLKTRPSFACNVNDYKGFIRNVCSVIDTDKSSHLEPFDSEFSKELEHMDNVVKVISVDRNQIVFGKNIEFNVKCADELCWCLFDYKDREPLNKEAYAYMLIFN